MKRRPLPVGMMVCDQVIIEEGSRNLTVVNCFDHRWVAKFPEKMSFWVVASLIDGSGPIRMELVLQSLADLNCVFSRSFSYEFNDPLKEVRFRVSIRNWSVPAPGSYQLCLLADDEFIAQTKFDVLAEVNP